MGRLYSSKVQQEMDDPDVDLELIALLRESLGFNKKAEDEVSSDTGKAQRLVDKFAILSISGLSSNSESTKHCHNMTNHTFRRPERCRVRRPQRCRCRTLDVRNS